MVWGTKLFLALSLFCSLFGGINEAGATPASPSSWQNLAQRVGPSESDRNTNIEKLKNITELNSILLRALESEDRALSLDVMSALNKTELLPELLKQIPKDKDGYLVLTVNTLISKSNESAIMEQYIKWINSKTDINSAALLAMLEPLNRLQSYATEELLTSLASHPSPEVRAEVLNILRSKLQSEKTDLDQYRGLLLTYLKDSAYSLRLQTYSLIQEFSRDFSKSSPLLELAEQRCKKELSSESLYNCHRILSLPYGQKLGPLLSQQDSFDIYVVFGYKDARPSRFVGDRHERLAFILSLLEPCPSSKIHTCGFTRSEKYPDVLYKKTKEKSLRIIVTHSAVSTDDQNNRNNPYQRLQSEYAERVFQEGLRRGHVVFYNGHSRFGGGPDFTYPRIDEKGEIDKNFYRSHREGLKDMLKNLSSNSNSRLQSFGLFSCSSTQYFKAGIQKRTEAQVITSLEALHHDKALSQSLEELNKILGSSDNLSMNSR